MKSQMNFIYNIKSLNFGVTQLFWEKKNHQFNLKVSQQFFKQKNI